MRCCDVLRLAGAKSGARASGEGIDSFSGVIYSDDDSDLSVSDIDEGVIARELKAGVDYSIITHHRS